MIEKNEQEFLKFVFSSGCGVVFQDNPTVVVEDLRLCTVKHCEDIERRFCFEVVSPTK